MKFLFTLICFVFVNTKCASKRIKSSENITENKKAVFIYKHYTRGFYKEHHIKEDKILTYLDYQKKEFTEKEMTPMDWAKCLELLTKIDLVGFEKFEAPSDLRFGDAAQNAELTIVINNTTFKSRGFDHGNPPKEIKPLVNHLLYLSLENDR